jgi:hypothetical protein
VAAKNRLSYRPTDNRMLFCYGRSVACVIATKAAQTTIAQSGEKRRPRVLPTPSAC